MTRIYSHSLARVTLVAVGGAVVYTAPLPGPTVVREVTLASNKASDGILLNNGYPFFEWSIPAPGTGIDALSIPPLDLRMVLEHGDQFVCTIDHLAAGGAVWLTLSGYVFSA